MAANLWSQVRDCFVTDDGSLPGIEITKLSPAGVAEIYAMLRRRSHHFGDPPEFWCRERDTSRPVDSVPNAAALVAASQAEAFHHGIVGVVVDKVELPVLGVFVFKDTIELDYRMGPEWKPEQVEAFFGLLKECCALDPAAVVVPAPNEGPPYPQRFERAWAWYKSSRQADAGPP